MITGHWWKPIRLNGYESCKKNLLLKKIPAFITVTNGSAIVNSSRNFVSGVYLWMKDWGLSGYFLSVENDLKQFTSKQTSHFIKSISFSSYSASPISENLKRKHKRKIWPPFSAAPHPKDCATQLSHERSLILDMTSDTIIMRIIIIIRA